MVLAKQAKHIVTTPHSVVVELYSNLVVDASNKKLFVNPADPHVKAYHAKHGDAPSVRFLNGTGFFAATLDKMYTHMIFSLFGAPGAIASLEMQLAAVRARDTDETSVQKTERVVGGLQTMMEQIEARRQAQPEDPPWVPTEKDLAM